MLGIDIQYVFKLCYLSLLSLEAKRKHEREKRERERKEREREKKRERKRERELMMAKSFGCCTSPTSMRPITSQSTDKKSIQRGNKN